MPTRTVMIFVEDPGAANYVLRLPPVLTDHGYRVVLLADGHAMQYLSAHDVTYTALPPETSASTLLAQYNPHLVVVGTSENPDTMGLKLVAEAKKMQVETVGLVDAFTNAEHRFRGSLNDPFAYVPDWLLVPDEATATAYVDLGFPTHRVTVCGHPHYDHVRALATQWNEANRAAMRAQLMPGLGSDQSAVIFATELSVGLDSSQFQRSEQYTLRGRGDSDTRTEIVLEEFLDAVALLTPKPYLILRLHPKNYAADFANYLKEFDLVSTGGSPLALAYAADLMVGMTSSLLAEAVLLGRQVLSIIPRACEADWLPLGTVIPYVTTRPALQSFLINWSQQSHQIQLPSDGGRHATSLNQIATFLTDRLEYSGTRKVLHE